MDQKIKALRDAADASLLLPDSQPPSRQSYVNASEVLPPDLLAAVQRHFSGGAIYVSTPETPYYAERRKLVLALHLRGVKTAEIARMARVSPRRVLQILAQTRKKSKK